MIREFLVSGALEVDVNRHCDEWMERSCSIDELRLGSARTFQRSKIQDID